MRFHAGAPKGIAGHRKNIATGNPHPAHLHYSVLLQFYELRRMPIEARQFPTASGGLPTLPGQQSLKGAIAPWITITI
jgi:hypothetical protein